MTERLKVTPYTCELWWQRYPRLVTILEDEPAAPKSNIVARNISYGSRWDEVSSDAQPYVSFSDDYVDQDPPFRGSTPNNVPSARQLTGLRGFEPIPLEKTGLYEDENRTELPSK